MRGPCCVLAVVAALAVVAVGGSPGTGTGRPTASSTLRFASSYGDHMVLQRDTTGTQRAVVWGYCQEGTSVEVTVAPSDSVSDQAQHQTVQATVTGSTWIAALPTKPASNSAYTVTAKDLSGATAQLTDVLFGDVWVCSGQSNMAFLLENAFNGSAMVQEANDFPLLRLFTSKKISSHVPLDEQPAVEEPWAVSSNVSVSDDGKLRGVGDDNWLYMSAVCYIFGRELHKALGIPIGLVNTNWGGTPVEFWMSADAVSSCNSSEVGKAGGAYNGMITPLLNMTIKGAIWYQGEANSGDPWTYSAPPAAHAVPGLWPRYMCHFPAMIADWRQKWHAGSLGNTDPEFFFGNAQLASWSTGGFGTAGVRYAQTGGYGYLPNAAMPNTFGSISIDLDDPHSPYGSVHIRDKTSVGLRLAAGGLAVAYGKDTYWQGPVGRTAKRVGEAIVVTFDNPGPDGIDVVNATGGWELGTGAGPGGASHGEFDGWFLAKAAAVPPADGAAGVPNAVSLTFLNASEAGAPVAFVRYAWSHDSVKGEARGGYPCGYKQCSVYAKGLDFPAGPFILNITAA